jgi:hypothetical protein
MIRYLRDRSYRAKPQQTEHGATQSGACFDAQSVSWL